jgi:hypothetical protein
MDMLSGTLDFRPDDQRLGFPVKIRVVPTGAGPGGCAPAAPQGDPAGLRA